MLELLLPIDRDNNGTVSNLYSYSVDMCSWTKGNEFLLLLMAFFCIITCWNSINILLNNKTSF